MGLGSTPAVTAQPCIHVGAVLLCLTSPLPHDISWDHLPSRAVHPNSCLGVCFGGAQTKIDAQLEFSSNYSPLCGIGLSEGGEWNQRKWAETGWIERTWWCWAWFYQRTLLAPAPLISWAVLNPSHHINQYFGVCSACLSWTSISWNWKYHDSCNQQVTLHAKHLE